MPISTSPGSSIPSSCAAARRGQHPPRSRRSSSDAGSGLTGVDDLRLVSAIVDEDLATVTLASPDGAEHRFELHAERVEPPRATSCRADEVEAPLHWSVVGP